MTAKICAGVKSKFPAVLTFAAKSLESITCLYWFQLFVQKGLQIGVGLRRCCADLDFGAVDRLLELAVAERDTGGDERDQQG